jgi:hypothetical protein
MKNEERTYSGVRIEWIESGRHNRPKGSHGGVTKRHHAEHCTLLYKSENKTVNVIFRDGEKTRRLIEGNGFSINGVDAREFFQCPEKYMPANATATTPPGPS